MSSTKRRTYLRDDGVVMVEVRSFIFVQEDVAERLGLLR